jgi:hypothetical protein
LGCLFLVMLCTTLMSTTAGAYQVEAGQRLGATGRLSSARSIGANVANMGGSALGGYMAGRAFGWVCGLAAACLILLIPIILGWLDERPESAAARAAAPALDWRLLRGARPLWLAFGMMLLIAFSPGITTPLFFVQTNQNHFSAPFLGWLGQVTFGASILGGFAYIPLARRVPLGWLTVGIVLASAGTTLCYLHYRTPGQAVVAEAAFCLAYELLTILLMDIASRVTPRGFEGFAFGLLWSGLMLLTFLSDLFGSYLYEVRHLPFAVLVLLNAGTTALSLLFLPFLPKALLAGREQTRQG